jgi:hypothetical protein
LTSEDVVRHRLVKQIINAYEKNQEEEGKFKYNKKNTPTTTPTGEYPKQGE